MTITADGIVLSQGHVTHWKFSDTVRPGSSPTGRAGDRTTVILHDGLSILPNCSAQSSTGSFPPAADQAGHRTASQRYGYGRSGRLGPQDRSPARVSKGPIRAVRLGRVIGGTAEIFGTDFMLEGGDSGGPFFSLDGQLAGIVHTGNGALELMSRHNLSFFRRNERIA